MTIAGKTAQAAFEWDCEGNDSLDYPYDFVPEEGDDVFFCPLLDDEDDDSAIDGHDIHFEATFIVVRYWTFDWETFEFSQSDEDTIEIPHGDDPEIVDGVYASNLLVITGTVELSAGEYRSVHTVYDYWECGENADFGIEVTEYYFRVYDNDCYKNQ